MEKSLSIRIHFFCAAILSILSILNLDRLSYSIFFGIIITYYFFYVSISNTICILKYNEIPYLIYKSDLANSYEDKLKSSFSKFGSIFFPFITWAIGFLLIINI